MATKSQAYDHPAYETPMFYTQGQLNGASAAGTKYVSFTNQIIKAITLWATTASTTNVGDVVSLVKISGTTTTTTAYGTFGSGVTGVLSLTPAVATNQVTTLQGDLFYVQKGADATSTYTGGAIEVVTQPLANFTV